MGDHRELGAEALDVFGFAAEKPFGDQKGK
jgi:hypothetical protein